MRLEPPLVHSQGRHFPTKRSSHRRVTMVLALVAGCRIGPALVPDAAQPAPTARPAVSDAKCDLITEAQVLRLAPGANLIDVLRTRVPGLQVNTGDWRSASASSNGLRGNNSLVGPSEPLIFLDGVRLPQPGGIGTLELIDPLDVERVEILPGPAATTHYGTGASNGVVLIYTKTGGSHASSGGAARGNCRR